MILNEWQMTMYIDMYKTTNPLAFVLEFQLTRATTFGVLTAWSQVLEHASFVNN